MDQKDVNEKLDDLIRKEVNAASKLTPGSKEKHSAICDIKILYEIRMKQEQQAADIREKRNARVASNQLKQQELDLKESENEYQNSHKDAEMVLKGKELDLKAKELDIRNAEMMAKEKAEEAEKASKDRAESFERRSKLADFVARTVISLISTIGPMALYGAVVTEGFRFEENGAISSTMFKGVLNKVNPTKL